MRELILSEESVLEVVSNMGDWWILRTKEDVGGDLLSTILGMRLYYVWHDDCCSINSRLHGKMPQECYSCKGRIPEDVIVAAELMPQEKL